MSLCESGLAQRASGTAFAIIYEPKRYPPPPRDLTKEELAAQRNRDNAKMRYYRKKPSQAQQSAISLETPAERMERYARGKHAPNFNTPIATQADSLRTAAIKGKL